MVPSGRGVLEDRAEPDEAVLGVLGHRPGPVGLHQLGGLGVGHVQVQAADRQGLERVQVPAQLQQPQQVGQAVDVAVRTGQRVDALSLIQRLPGLQVTDQLTEH
jgi:hypothetical protein